jgi:hypothetical protein
MQGSYDCPECFIVVKYPDILRCLYCGCEWQLTLPADADDEAAR